MLSAFSILELFVKITYLVLDRGLCHQSQLVLIYFPQILRKPNLKLLCYVYRVYPGFSQVVLSSRCTNFSYITIIESLNKISTELQ